MATVAQPFLARNRRFEVGEHVDDGDPLVNDYPHLFGLEPARDDDDDDVEDDG